MSCKILSKEEKKKKVIELYQEGLSYRKIAKLVRISVRDISIIINDFTGEGRKSMSVNPLDRKPFKCSRIRNPL